MFVLLESIAQKKNPNMHVAYGPFFFLGLFLEIIAMAFGFASWQSKLGKITGIICICLFVFTFVAIILSVR